MSAAHGGMPELPDPRKVSSTNSKGIFLIISESLPLTVFSASLGCLIPLAEVVCQNSLLPAVKNQLTDGQTVSENSFI
jgi:hypothetical protein